MSEKTLRTVLERLQKDKEFHRRMQYDWQGALKDLELSQAEVVALATQDEDSLRRLAGSSAVSQGLGFFGTQFICSWLCTIVFTTVPLDTKGSTRDTCPGSGQGCGTHNTHNCGGETVGPGFCC